MHWLAECSVSLDGELASFREGILRGEQLTSIFQQIS